MVTVSDKDLLAEAIAKLPKVQNIWALRSRLSTLAPSMHEARDPLAVLYHDLTRAVEQTDIRYGCGRYVRAHFEPSRSAGFPDVLRYTTGYRIAHEVTVGAYLRPPEGFRFATDTEQDCADCKNRANRFLRNRRWRASPPHPRNLCRTCLRSPVDYLLVRAPEHAIWFERAAMLAATTGDDQRPEPHD